MCVIYRIIFGKLCCGESLLDAQTVKLNPYVFPRKLVICDIGIYLAGKNQKALPAFYVLGLCNALCIIGHQSAGAGQYIVE